MNDVPLTEWLRASGRGDADAGHRAYALIYSELRKIAARQAASLGASATLTPTALVNEAFLKLAGGSLAAVNDRRHFFNLAARAMRQTIVDYARERLAEKRGGDLVRTDLSEQLPIATFDATQALALDQAFSSLEKQDARLAQMLHWRVFAGLTAEQIAELCGVTQRSVNRNLAIARNYLLMAMDAA